MKPININANLADSDANVHCLMNGLHMTCCADTGAHNSIISDQTFNDLNLDKTSLNTQQRYNIKTATSLELDAVQGVIIVPLVFFNLSNGKAQKLDQKFLVLRPGHFLNMPLIGCDFLKANKGAVYFHPNRVTEVVINNEIIGTPPDNIKVRFQHTSTTEHPERNMPGNESHIHGPLHELLDSTYYPGEATHERCVPIHVFSSFVQQCRQEKISNVKIRNIHIILQFK